MLVLRITRVCRIDDTNPGLVMLEYAITNPGLTIAMICAAATLSTTELFITIASWGLSAALMDIMTVTSPVLIVWYVNQILNNLNYAYNCYVHLAEKRMLPLD